MSNSIIGALRVMLGMDSSEFEDGANSAARAAQRFERQMDKLGGNLQKIGVGMTAALTAPLAAFGVSAFNAASDAAELQSAFNQTFGDLADEMNAWAETTGDAFGRSTQSMQEMAVAFGGFFNQAAPTRKEAAEMSKTFAELAQDLGSFYNVTESEALAKLRSGLSGETEPLRDFQVFLTEANVAAKALELGLTGVNDPLTEQEKILARYNLILEGTKVAQGDVARTADGTANQIRAAQAAFAELQVEIGTKLLPVITPLIENLTGLIGSFTQLPDGMQTTILAAVGIAAALGPVITVIGTVLPLIGSFVSGLSGLVAAAASTSAAGAAVNALLAISGAVAAPLAAFAAVGALIYKEWDRIAPLLQQFWEVIQETLGPPLQELVGTISATLSDLWNGGFGEGLRTAGSALAAFGGVVADILGSALVAVIGSALLVVQNAFTLIGGAISVVVRLLQGDFAGAWEAAVGTARKMLDNFLRTVETVFPGALGYVRQLYEGVKTWLMDKLGAVFDWVGKKVQQVSQFFFDMYDAVVGNSYVPDMVDGIAAEFDRLDAVMVDPARKATASVTEAARQMASDVQGLLNRPLPEVEKVKKAVEDMNAAFEKGAAKTEVQTVRIADTVRDMAERISGSLRGLVDGIKSGDFFDIFDGILNIVSTLGQAGAFGSKFQSFLGSVPGFANGGAMQLGGFAGIDRNVLSLNGSPIARVSRGETMEIRNGGARGGATVVNNYYTLPSDEFWSRVDGRAGAVVGAAAPVIEQRGAGRALKSLGNARRGALA
jgi:phage-related protein